MIYAELSGKSKDSINNIIPENKLTKHPLGYHLTIFGFYSDSDLEEQIISSWKNFDKISSTNLPIFSNVTETTSFGSHYILLLKHSTKLLDLHIGVVNSMLPYVILHNGRYASQDKSHFAKRYEHILSNFNPHISLGKKLEDFDTYVLSKLKNIDIKFDKLVLARKSWKKLQ